MADLSHKISSTNKFHGLCTISSTCNGVHPLGLATIEQTAETWQRRFTHSLKKVTNRKRDNIGLKHALSPRSLVGKQSTQSQLGQRDRQTEKMAAAAA
jgi:hypothetical protein